MATLLSAVVADPGADATLQHTIYQSASGLSGSARDQVLINLLALPDLDPQLDRAIGAGPCSARLTRAWLDRPNRTREEVMAAAADRRHGVATVVASTPGLDQDTYRVLAGRCRPGVAQALCANLDVTDDIVADALLHLGAPTMGRNLLQDLLTAVAVRPGLAELLVTDVRTTGWLYGVLIRAAIVDGADIDLAMDHVLTDCGTPYWPWSPVWEVWWAALTEYSLDDTTLAAMDDRLREAQTTSPDYRGFDYLLETVDRARRAPARARRVLPTIGPDTDIAALISEAGARRDARLAGLLWATTWIDAHDLRDIAVHLSPYDHRSLVQVRRDDPYALGLLLATGRIRWAWRTHVAHARDPRAVIVAAAQLHTELGMTTVPRWWDTGWTTPAAVAALSPAVLCAGTAPVVVRTAVRDVIVGAIGSDRPAWRLLTSLAAGYTGSLQTLLAAVTDTLEIPARTG